MKKSSIIALLVMSLALFLAMAVILIGIIVREGPSEDNTTEFMATVRNIEIRGTESNKYGVLHTNEYGAELIRGFGIITDVDIDKFSSLETGQTVFFRIENIWLDQFEETRFIHIVSLRTEETEILSLSRYIEHMNQQNFRGKMMAIGAGTIFLLASIHWILRLRGVNIFHKLKKH